MDIVLEISGMCQKKLGHLRHVSSLGRFSCLQFTAVSLRSFDGHGRISVPLRADQLVLKFGIYGGHHRLLILSSGVFRQIWCLNCIRPIRHD